MKIDELIKLVNTLRSECPWDRQQTLDSLKNNLIEEAYEFVEALEEGNLSAIKEEIGDIIFLGFFLARVLEEEKGIDFDDLIRTTVEKYKYKHPHIFRKRKIKDSEAVLKFWQKSKKDIFLGIPKILPALLAAKIIQERAAKLGFDWNSHKGPLDKVREELREMETSDNTKRICEEFGDLLFACVNLARHFKIDPEDALRNANKKFVKRFRKIIKELKRKGKDIEKTPLEEMDKIWNDIKREE